MDVTALYPSIDIEFSVDKCVELIQQSNVQFNHVNLDELGLYLALCVDEEILVSENLRQYCPVRKKRGKRPTITGSGSIENEDRRWEPWRKSITKPTEESEKKRMISFALGVAMKTTLKNHIFKFGSEIRKQQNGGAIGVKAAGDIAGLFMVWWDRTFMELAKDILKMYCRYVDDEPLVAKVIPKCSEDDTSKDDERTMRKLQQIANSIHQSIQLTVDYPSNNENDRIPILDTEQWIEEIEIGGVKKHQILHSHYSKPMANKLVIHRNSALSNNTKMTILAADLLRVMKNISKHCSNHERTQKIQDIINRMQFSGYKKSE
jgi:hypothetical protein